jgi:uncharacterized protein YecT (DUF1311 family)
MRATLAIMLLLLLALPAAPQDCGGKLNQGAINACAASSLRQGDARLNDAYGQIVSRLKVNPPAREALLDAQRSWIRFRDAECGFTTFNSRDGSVAPFLMAQCKERLTAARVAQLQEYLSCTEGDLDCPVPGR